MKKIIICPDSFKGTLTSVQVASTIAEAIKDTLPQTQIVIIPIADGGEGTLECFYLADKGEYKEELVRDSNFNIIKAKYLLRENEALIESAKVVGLSQTKIKNPAITTTFGIGELILSAIKVTNIIVLALGGSSTNDGGCGMLSALGAKFFDKDGNVFIPTGGTLKDIESIDVSCLPKIDITCMCDVENVMFGENGASYVFAPQKGADESMVKMLDKGLRHLAKKIYECNGVDVSEIVGGGAAGAISACMVAFFDAKLLSGINVLLDTVDFDSKIEDAQLIITGEGRLDSQSFQGKVIAGILERANKFQIPVVAVCGQIRGVDISTTKLKMAIESQAYALADEKIHRKIESQANALTDEKSHREIESQAYALTNVITRDYKNEVYQASKKLLELLAL